jgi:hypothetical protein
MAGTHKSRFVMAAVLEKERMNAASRAEATPRYSFFDERQMTAGLSGQ